LGNITTPNHRFHSKWNRECFGGIFNKIPPKYKNFIRQQTNGVGDIASRDEGGSNPRRQPTNFNGFERRISCGRRGNALVRTKNI
jgi:hypothetical protein